MLVAGKLLEPTWGNAIDELVYLCDGCYKKDELLHMEVQVLHLVEFKVSIAGPTQLAFLSGFAAALSFEAGATELHTARFVCAKMLEDFGMLAHSASEAAAAALLLALEVSFTLRRQEKKDLCQALAKASGYEQAALRRLALKMLSVMLRAEPAKRPNFSEPGGAIRELFVYLNDTMPTEAFHGVVRLELLLAFIMREAAKLPPTPKEEHPGVAGLKSGCAEELALIDQYARLWCSISVGDSWVCGASNYSAEAIQSGSHTISLADGMASEPGAHDMELLRKDSRWWRKVPGASDQVSLVCQRVQLTMTTPCPQGGGEVGLVWKNFEEALDEAGHHGIMSRKEICKSFTEALVRRELVRAAGRANDIPESDRDPD
jgi:hypothetical protein